MAKTIIALTFLLSASMAKASDLVCNVKINAEEAAVTEFTVAPNTEVTYAVLEGYKFFVSNLGNSKFELEIYDSNGPTRSYATGHLRNLTDDLSWTLWSREILLETTCKLAR